MAIGQLYSPANVVIGQAAVFIAPANTPLPVYSAATININDPFDPTPWVQTKLQASATITAGTYTLTYTKNGTAYTTSSIAYTAAASAVDAAITTALTALNPAITSTDVIVTGGPVSAVATPFSIVLAEYLLGGVWTITPTGVTGGTINLTNGIWTPLGSTDAGWSIGGSSSTQKIYIEEQSTPVGQTIQNRDFTIQGALAEDTSQTLQVAWNATSSITAPGVGQSGYVRTVLTDTVLTYAVAAVTMGANGLAEYVYAPVWTSLATATTAFRRANAKRMYPVTFETICATGLISADKFFAPGT